MTSKELQIGDWIQELGPMRVTALKPNAIGCDVPRLWVYRREVKPIPITAEILEKNGWKHYPEDDERGLMEHYVLTDVGNAYFFPNGYIEFEIIGMRAKGRLRKELQFVHELQHALRLCGLAELADNFKIG